MPPAVSLVPRRRAVTLAVGLLAALAALLPHHADAAMRAPMNVHFVAGGTAPVYGWYVWGYEGKSVLVSVSTNVGTLTMANQAGTTPAFGYGLQGSELLFSGTQDQVNTALASVRLTTPAPAKKVTKPGVATTPVTIKGMATEYRADLTYFPKTQHFYKYVPIGKCVVDSDSGCSTAEQTARNPDTAKAAAEASTELGQTGYLASITSAEENAFVSEKIFGATAVIIGGRDAGSEGTWQWIGGPDNGSVFWKGCAAKPNKSGITPGSAVGYANWSTGEPNDYGTASPCGEPGVTQAPAENEDCTVTNWTDNSASEQVGYWNDVPCGNNAYTARRVRGYIAEFGNKAVGGDYRGVDLVEKTIARQLPVTKPTPNVLENLFKKLFVSKKAKKLPKKPKMPATFTAKLRVQMNIAGTYSIYVKRPDGKGVPFEFQPGSKTTLGKGLLAKSTTLKKMAWTMTVKTTKDDEIINVAPVLKTNDWAKPGGTKIFFSLVAPDAGSKNQMCLANWCQSATIPVPGKR